VLTRAHFIELRGAFGDDPLGSARSLAQRKDTARQAASAASTRDWIAARGDSLDIAWLKDEGESATDELLEPSTLTQEAIYELEGRAGGTSRDSGGVGRGGEAWSELPDSWVETTLGDITADSAQRVPAPDEQFQYVDICIDRSLNKAHHKSAAPVGP